MAICLIFPKLQTLCLFVQYKQALPHSTVCKRTHTPPGISFYHSITRLYKENATQFSVFDDLNWVTWIGHRQTLSWQVYFHYFYHRSNVQHNSLAGVKQLGRCLCLRATMNSHCFCFFVVHVTAVSTPMIRLPAWHQWQALPSRKEHSSTITIPSAFVLLRVLPLHSWGC